MESEAFSFSKRPILPPNQQRHSVISTHLPSDSDSAGCSQNQAQNNNMSFFDSAQSDMMSDDPLLDYNEQIRAPKFRQHKSLDSIGALVDKEINNPPRTGDLTSFGNRIHTETTTHSEPVNGKKYQPAEVDVSQIKSGLLDSNSTYHDSVSNMHAFLDNVSFNHANSVIRNLNMEYTHETSSGTSNSTTANNTVNTSPISSKKSSNDSINSNFIESKKIPRFNMTPIKPIDEPKTPNYLPCVLRTSFSMSKNKDYLDIDSISKIRSHNSSTSLEEQDITYKPHWKPNKSASSCLDCKKAFSLMNRRHHCRKCGEIFCGNCLLFKAKMIYDDDKERTEFASISGIKCKVCFKCGKDFGDFILKSFQNEENVQTAQFSSLFPDLKKNGSLKSLNARVMKTETDSSLGGALEGETSAVPIDWTWSSF